MNRKYTKKSTNTTLKHKYQKGGKRRKLTSKAGKKEKHIKKGNARNAGNPHDAAKVQRNAQARARGKALGLIPNHYQSSEVMKNRLSQLPKDNLLESYR